MNYKNIKLQTESGVNLSLSNSFPKIFLLTDAIEDSKDSIDLLERLGYVVSHIKEFYLDRETENYIRYKLVTRMCNNTEYLIIYK